MKSLRTKIAESSHKIQAIVKTVENVASQMNILHNRGKCRTGNPSSIEEISAVVLTNSATAEEGAASSKEMSGQAQLLKNLIAQFKLQK